MSEDLERALRARKEFDAERDRRLEERFRAQDDAVRERFQAQQEAMRERFRAQENALKQQLMEVRRRLSKIEEQHNRLAGLVLGAPVVTAIIVYLLTRSGG